MLGTRGFALAVDRRCGRSCRSPVILMSSFKPTARHLRCAAAAHRSRRRSTNYVRSVGALARLLHRPAATALIVTAGATLLAVVASHARRLRLLALSQRACWPRSAFFLIFVRLLPPIVITLPLFPMVNWLGLNDTHLVLIMLYATFFVSLGT